MNVVRKWLMNPRVNPFYVKRIEDELLSCRLDRAKLELQLVLTEAKLQHEKDWGGQGILWGDLSEVLELDEESVDCAADVQRAVKERLKALEDERDRLRKFARMFVGRTPRSWWALAGYPEVKDVLTVLAQGGEG